MSVQTRIVFIAGLLVLAICASILAANATWGAIQNVHQHEIMVRNQDVNLIQPWMTIPYIAHVYRVPERTLYQPLQLQSNPTIRHSTLQIIATYKKQPVENVVHKVQEIILTYRKLHPPGKAKPTSTPIITRGELVAH